MRKYRCVSWDRPVVLCVVIVLLLFMGQNDLFAQHELAFGHSKTSIASLEAIPTDRIFDADGDLISSDLYPSLVEGGFRGCGRPTVAKANRDRFCKPSITFAAEWEPESSGLAVSSYDLGVRIPLFSIFGKSPRIITAGFSWTNFDAPAIMDLPSELVDASLGMAWTRRLNQQWSIRFMLSANFGSDLENTSSDAWRFRRGAFAMYRRSEQLQYVFGAMGTGRSDIPVVPVLGAIWTPTPRLRLDLRLPAPRISWMLADYGDRQHWLYTGGGFGGGTWAYERVSGLDELMTYREWRLVLGWETTPPRTPGMFLGNSGTKFGVEIGYILGRRIEFESDAATLDLGDAVMLRTTMNF